MHVSSIPRTPHKDPVQLLAFSSGRQEIGSAVMSPEYSGHAVITVAPEKATSTTVTSNSVTHLLNTIWS
jgi:hypothetical protein